MNEQEVYITEGAGKISVEYVDGKGEKRTRSFYAERESRNNPKLFFIRWEEEGITTKLHNHKFIVPNSREISEVARYEVILKHLYGAARRTAGKLGKIVDKTRIQYECTRPEKKSLLG